MALRHTATWRAALFPAKQYYNSTGPEHHPPLRASRTTKMAKPTRLTPLRHGEGPWYEQTTGGGVITAPLSALEGPPICPDLGLVFFVPPLYVARFSMEKIELAS